MSTAGPVNPDLPSHAMLQQHAQYVHLLAAHPTGMVVVDHNGVVVYANAAAQQLFAVPLVELLNRPWPLESTPPQPADLEVQIGGHAGLTSRHEQIAWMADEATLVVLNDTTQQAASGILRSVTDSMQVTVLRFDSSLRCCYVSPNVAVSLLVAPAAALNSDCYGLNLTPRMAARMERTLRETFASGEHRQIDIEFPTLDAYTIYDTHFVPEPAADGTPATVLLIMQDTTGRRQLERDLQASRRFAQQLADALPGLVYIYDIGEERSIYTNYAFSSLLGYATESIRVQTGGLLGALMHPDDTVRWSSQILPRYSLMDDGAYIENEFRARHADGRWCWFLCREIVWRRTPEGQPEQVLGIAQDISLRKAIEGALAEERSSLAKRVAERTAELSAANIELAQAARLKDEFLANMSHELRTPLQAILGLAENLEQGLAGPLTEKQVRYVQIVLESGQHLLSLINDILEFSRIEGGRFEPSLAPVSVARLCESSMRLVREQAIRKGLTVTVTVNIDAQVDGILADERMLKQILINLLGNAVKFTPPGGAIGLEVAGDPERETVSFAVWDTGIGIAPEDLARLFRPFVQLEAGLNRQYAGTGLGLALVSRLARLHNGSVALASVKDNGSRFTVAIPWERVGVSALHASSETMKAMAIQRSLQRLRATGEKHPSVLLVEDAVMCIDALTACFVGERCEVLTARNGQEGLAMARQLQPTLILVDIHVPDIDNIEAAQRLRSALELTGRPVVALTSLLLPGDPERLLEGGFEAVRTLPLTQRDVAALCTTYCAMRT